MCKPSPVETLSKSSPKDMGSTSLSRNANEDKIPPPPSFVARYTCVSILVGIFALWGQYAFVDEDKIPGASDVELHSWQFPALMGISYLLSLPALRWFSNKFLLPNVDVKLLLRESMILYNAAQVVINGWMVYRFIDAVLFRGHPAIGGPIDLVDTGATYAIWVHYCDKYLEFLDTYFMVLRGRMDQVGARGLV